MNVAILDNSIGYTGAFKSAVELARYLHSSKKVIFIVPKGSKNIELLYDYKFTTLELPICELSRSLSRNLFYPFRLITNTYRLKKLLNDESVDLLIVNDYYNLLGSAVKIFGWKGSLLTYIRVLPDSRPMFLNWIWSSLALRFSRSVICVSKAVKSQLGGLGKAVEIIYDHICLDLESKIDYQCITKARLQSPTVNVICIGNFTLGKGQDVLLSAFREAVINMPTLRLRLIGGDFGLLKNIKYKNELLRLIVDTQLSDKVELLDFESDIFRHLKWAHLFVNLSVSESFSKTCIEAMQAGCVIVSSYSGGPEEYIQHGLTGFLVDRTDLVEISRLLERLAGNRESCRNIGYSARSYVIRRFTVKSFRTRVSQVITN